MRTMEEYVRYITDNGITHVLGIDEVGLGAIAGPFVMASCLIPAYQMVEGLKDSKKLSNKTRETLVPVLRDSFYHHIAVMDAPQLDAAGISWAKTALARDLIQHFYQSNPQEIIDSSVIVFDGADIMAPAHTRAIALVKADNLVPSVMAASNIAKLHRDAYMYKAHEVYPMYVWNKNVGYPTHEHLDLLQQHGPCLEHRKSYKPVYQRLK